MWGDWLFGLVITWPFWVAMILSALEEISKRTTKEPKQS